MTLNAEGVIAPGIACRKRGPLSVKVCCARGSGDKLVTRKKD